jgi:hypothetical protein
MLLYVIGRKSDKKVLETGFRSDFDAAAFASAVAANYGGAPADYTVYTVDESDAKAQRVKQGDTFAPAWSGIGAASAVTDLDFTAEDAKKILRYEVDAPAVLVNGGVSVTVTVSVLLADRSGTDVSFEKDLDIPIRTPERAVKMRFSFVKGVASRAVTPTVAGVWIFPAGKLAEFRNENGVSFDTIY